MLTLIQIITIITLILTIPKHDNEITKSITDKDIFSVLEDENIIVFLLDMFDNTYFQKIIEDEPELLQELEGFTYFSNSVGSHNTTSYFTAMLFTGQYLLNEDSYYTQYNNAFKKAPMIYNLDKNGYLIDIYLDERNRI